MNKLTLPAAIIILSIPFQIRSQDSLQKNLFPVESSGQRATFEIEGWFSAESNKYPNYNNFVEYSNKLMDLNAHLGFAAWEYSKEINYLGILDAQNTYRYLYGKTEPSDLDKRIDNNLAGTLYGSADYYHKPNKFYFNGSFGESFNYRYRYSLSEPIIFSAFENSSTSIYYYLWVSAGFGRLINKARIDKLDNFEQILVKDKSVPKPLNKNLKKKLTALLERRNNKDYLAKYKDDNDIKFMGDIEKLLLNEGVIDKPLGAETVMKLYRALTNTKFIYYPDFRGIQTQLEYQFQLLEGDSRNDYITLSSAYGFSPGNNTSTLLSGFVSLPLKAYTSDEDLFVFGIRNPFSNKLPLIAELYGLDNYPTSFYGDHRGSTGYNNLSYVTGLKFNVFHSFSSHFGIQLWGQGIASKPKDTGYRNTIKLGFQLDYNILSIVNLNFALDWFRNNSGYQQFYSSIGTSLIIY